MFDIVPFEKINPYVRMMHLKRTTSLSGKWRDIDHVFTYIAEGSGDFIIDGNRYSLETGSVIIIPPYKTHIIISQGEEMLVQCVMHFDFFETEERVKLLHRSVSDEVEQYVIPAKERMLHEAVLIADIPRPERSNMRRRYLELLHEYEGRGIGRDLMLKAGCIQLLMATLRAYTANEDLASNVGVRQTKSWIHIENAIKYIDRCNLESEMNNDVIAEAIGITPNYLTKVFREYLGIPLHKYIVCAKVEKAQKKLMTGNVNITEAAEAAGFSSVHVFSKTFKRMFGVSPSEFLNQIVNKENMMEERETMENVGGIYVDRR